MLHVQTQQCPSVVHVTIFTLETEELAMFYQQLIIVEHFGKPCCAKTSRQSMQRVFFLFCLSRSGALIQGGKCLKGSNLLWHKTWLLKLGYHDIVNDDVHTSRRF